MKSGQATYPNGIPKFRIYYVSIDVVYNIQ